MLRRMWAEWHVRLAWTVAGGALVAFTILNLVGQHGAGNPFAAIMAATAIYGAYGQHRASRKEPQQQQHRASLVLVCYVREDLRWAHWLEDRLHSAGFLARIQQIPTSEKTAAITQWAGSILTDAACVLVVGSKRLRDAGPGVVHRLGAAVSGRRGRERVVYVETDDGEALEGVGELQTVSIAGIADDVHAWQIVDGAIRSRGARSSTRRAEAYGGLSVTFPGVGVANANLPAANPNFVGRTGELAYLTERLIDTPGDVTTRRVTIHAMSGMGKTQLAAQFAAKQRDLDVVWWINAHQRAAAYEALSSLAQKLGQPEIPDENEMRRQLWERLRISGRWLLVYDNAESEEKIKDLVPPAGNGSLLITSQSPNWATDRYELRQMSDDDAIVLLRRRVPVRDDKVLSRIAEQLGWLPLALEQAASYMRETQCPPARYLSNLTRRFSETLERGTQTYYDKSAGTTYRIAREHTTETEPLSGLLLELCGVFAPDSIPRDLFEDPEQAPVLPRELAAALEAGLPYDGAVAAARKFSLLTVTERSFTMHRVVQKLIRDSLKPDVRKERVATAVALLSRAFPDDPDDARSWDTCGALQSHCDAALAEVERHNLVSVESIRLNRLVGEYLRVRGAFDAALESLNRGLAQVRDCYDKDELAATEIALARVYYGQADLREAKEHALAALDVHEMASPADDTKTAATLLHLSEIQLELSEFAEALGNAKRSLSIHREADDDSSVMAGLSLETLGIVQWRLGEWPEAVASLTESVSIFTTAFGADSGPTGRIHSALGLVLRDSAFGDLDGLRLAETEFDAAYRNLRGAQGLDHPDTVSAAIHLADTHRRMALAERRITGDDARFAAACAAVEAEFEDAMARLPMREKKPGRACGLVRQGHLFSTMGDHHRARELVQEARGIYMQSYGADHPYVAEALTRLTTIEYALDDHPEAERLAHDARRIYVNKYGDQHPYVRQIDAFLADPATGGRD